MNVKRVVLANGRDLYKVTSETTDGTVYTVQRCGPDAGRIVCDCKHFLYRLARKPDGECKHIAAAREYAYQERPQQPAPAPQPRADQRLLDRLWVEWLGDTAYRSA